MRCASWPHTPSIFGGFNLLTFFTFFFTLCPPCQSYSLHKTIGTYGKFLVPLHIAGAGFHVVKGQSIFARINPFR